MVSNFDLNRTALNNQMMGLSTDTKPTTGILPNSLFWELDTNGMYYFDGTQWQSIGGSGGGGGSSDFSTVQMTVTGDGGSFTVYPAAGQESDWECDFINSNNNFTQGVYAPQGESVTVTVIFMGDSAIVSPYNVVKSVTGDATYDQETGLITATGDFTVAGFMDD